MIAGTSSSETEAGLLTAVGRDDAAEDDEHEHSHSPFQPLSLAELAAQAGKTGGPINGHAQLNVTGAGPGFGVHCCDLKVDADTGIVTIGRYTAAQDVGSEPQGESA